MFILCVQLGPLLQLLHIGLHTLDTPDSNPPIQVEATWRVPRSADEAALTQSFPVNPQMVDHILPYLDRPRFPPREVVSLVPAQVLPQTRPHGLPSPSRFLQAVV
ncbi:uncharacterized protein LAESUDRAFT_731297, partial [Laetiporus sulphureus 93-53]